MSDNTTDSIPQRPLPETAALLAAGNRLRDGVPTASHGLWREPANRADPIETLRPGDAKRLPELVPIRYGRMLASPFAFYRGAAAVMAGDLASTPVSGVRVPVRGLRSQD